MTVKVAIIGRPNVGKSTLFNRLTHKASAIVHDSPGVTRDRREGRADLLGLSFSLVDTAGLEDSKPETIAGRMRKQTHLAIEQADVILFLIDAREGINAADSFIAESLHKLRDKTIVVANKCEGRAGKSGLYEAYQLGLGEPVAISAEHGEGMGELLEALLPYMPPDDEDHDLEPLDSEDNEEAPNRPLKLAIIGRPNVGKSTLTNQLLKEERLLTGPEAGLTRDSISVEWQYEGRPIILTDTAGLRKKARIEEDSLERLANIDTLTTIRYSEVVVLVIDAVAGLEQRDLILARMIINEGRALVLAVNKWDQITDRQLALKQLKDKLESSLAQVKGLPLVTLSALSGQGIQPLMQAVFHIYALWNKRVTTSQLNQWLAEVTANHPPPALAGGRRLRLKYMTQIKARPPTFVIFSSRADLLPETYLRYLSNMLREHFDLPGIALRLLLRSGKNPYNS